MNKYECDVLDDNIIKQLALRKLLNIKNVLGILAVIMLAVILVVIFNNNILTPSESVLREQEVKNTLMVMTPFVITEIIFIIVFYIKIKRYFKVITGNYKCVLTSVADKKETHSQKYYSDGTTEHTSRYFVDLNGIEKFIVVSADEYKTLHEKDNCYAIVADNSSTEKIVANNIILVIKANNYGGKNQVVKMVE